MVWTERCAVWVSVPSVQQPYSLRKKSSPSVGLCVFGYCVTVCLRAAERTAHGLGGWSHWWSSGLSSCTAWCRCPGEREAHLLQCGGQFAQPFAIAAGAVSIPGSDAAGQDALHSTGVEWVEDVGTHSKFPQSSEEKDALLCLLQHCICVSWPCEVLSDGNS